VQCPRREHDQENRFGHSSSGTAVSTGQLWSGQLQRRRRQGGLCGQRVAHRDTHPEHGGLADQLEGARNDGNTEAQGDEQAGDALNPAERDAEGDADPCPEPLRHRPHQGYDVAGRGTGLCGQVPSSGQAGRTVAGQQVRRQPGCVCCQPDCGSRPQGASAGAWPSQLRAHACGTGLVPVPLRQPSGTWREAGDRRCQRQRAGDRQAIPDPLGPGVRLERLPCGRENALVQRARREAPTRTTGVTPRTHPRVLDTVQSPRANLTHKKNPMHLH
jgi:hypothetical protein